MRKVLLLMMVIMGCMACAAQTVPTSVFSAGFNKSNSPWCPIDGNSVNAQIYGFRIWDDGAKLSHIWPTSFLAPSWTQMDALIVSRALSGGCPGTPMKVNYTFGGMPAWASACAGQADPSTCLPGPVGSGFGGGTQCVGPTDYGCLPAGDLATDGTGTDSNYVSMAVAIEQRYLHQIAYYEIWNEADSSNFYCQAGTPVPCGGGNAVSTPNTVSLKRLVRMGWDLKNVMACLDPAVKILSPSMHVATALTWFHNFNITSINAPAGVAGVNGVPAGCNWNAATVTGAQVYDYTNIHARGNQFAYPNLAGNWNPAAMINAWNNLKTEIANDSLPNPTIMFNNEFGYNTALEGGTVTSNFMAFVAQSYILCASLQFQQCYWYQWDTTTIGLSQTVQGTAYDTAAGWLIGSTPTSTCAETGTIWQCGFTVGGLATVFAWDSAQYSTTTCCTTANHAFGSQYTTYTDLATNTSHPTSGGNGTVALGWQPVMVQQTGGSPPAAPTQVQGTVTAKGTVKIF